jgi:hypothetical protein
MAEKDPRQEGYDDKTPAHSKPVLWAPGARVQRPYNMCSPVLVGGSCRLAGPATGPYIRTLGIDIMRYAVAGPYARCGYQPVRMSHSIILCVSVVTVKQLPRREGDGQNRRKNENLQGHEDQGVRGDALTVRIPLAMLRLHKGFERQ